MRRDLRSVGEEGYQGLGPGRRGRIARHGHTVSHTLTPEWRTWSAMRERCNTPSCRNYPDYGGRGISVCDRWDVFENFLADMGFRPSDNHSIDRIDPNGNYEPSNCRWATRKQQGRNKRNNRLLTVDGMTRTIAEWSELHGVKAGTINARVSRYGWSHSAAVMTRAMTTNEVNMVANTARYGRSQ